MMTKMSAATFKTHCLAVIDEVHAKRQPILITKHGKPIAKGGNEPLLHCGLSRRREKQCTYTLPLLRHIHRYQHITQITNRLAVIVAHVHKFNSIVVELAMSHRAVNPHRM